MPLRTIHQPNPSARLLVLLFLAPCLYSTIAAQESSGRTYQSTASEVRLVFFATDENNHSIQDLQESDFAVVDDEKVIRDFRSFTRSPAVGLDVVVLFDSSESVLPHFQREIAEIRQLISEWPFGPEDNLAVLSFSGIATHPVCAEDCGSSLTADQVDSVPKGGTTPLFDALEAVISLLSKRTQPDVWPVILLFSDGDDTISMSSLQRVLQKLLASGAQVYAIDLGSPTQHSIGTATLHEIAEASGGRYLRIGEGASRILSDILDDFHSARMITYALPESSSDFHSVRILPTHNLNLRFRSRNGYYQNSGNTR
jgi:VWFA-related protein